MSWFYHFTVNRSRRETVARFVFKNQQGANFLLDIFLIRKPIVQEHGAVGACSSPAVVETRFAVRYWHQVEVEREVESVTRT
jgi:hypothetical protein